MIAEDILIEPLRTEKAVDMMAKGFYSFYVHPKSTKGQIKEAIENIFSVDVIDIKTIKKPGKLRRMRGRSGYTSDRKKAIIKLKEGQNIKIFEGA